MLPIPLFAKLIPYGLLSAVAIFSSKRLLLAAAAAALTLLLIIDFFSDTWHHGKMWAHGLIGIIGSRTGYHSTSSTGGVLQINWQCSVLVALFFTIVTAVELYTRLLDQGEPLMFHNFGHMLIYSLGGFLISIMGIQHWGQRAGWSQSRISNLWLARHLMDPVGMIALGVLLFGHMHDDDPLKRMRHQVIGIMMCLLGTVQFLCMQTHTSLPFTHTKCQAMRNLHGFCWMLAGLWLFGIGVTDVLGLTDAQMSAGVKEPPSMEILWGAKSGPQSPLEDCTFFITLDLLVCAVAMGCRQMSSDQPVVRGLEEGGAKDAYEQIQPLETLATKGCHKTSNQNANPEDFL